MEDTTPLPLFKKIDRAIFEGLDKFKLSPNYNTLQDFYNGLEEEQQKIFKASTIVSLFVIPLVILLLTFWQNNRLKDDFELRKSIVSKANEIIGQNQSLREIKPSILSLNPIDSSSMMTSRLSNLLSAISIDLNKFQVSDFESSTISSGVSKAEANFAFSNVSTDELMNAISGMIQKEKFRISSIDIKRNADNNLLQGQFRAIHYSAYTPTEEQE